MTKPPRPKICIGENILNTKDLTADRLSGASVDCRLFQVNVTVLDVCVNVHFTLVHRRGVGVLESVRATTWQTH